MKNLDDVLNPTVTFDKHRKQALFMRKCREQNPEIFRIRAKKRYDEKRDALFILLGNACAHCGLCDRRCLQFDHINGDGWKEAKGRNRSSSTTLVCKWLADPDIKSKLQVLCANCNWIKRAENKEIGQKLRPGRPRKYLN